jgi:hypothetical protein
MHTQGGDTGWGVAKKNIHIPPDSIVLHSMGLFSIATQYFFVKILIKNTHTN